MKSPKIENKRIHMLNARDNIIMTLINNVNKGINMFEEINNEFTIFLDMLENKGIEYSKLSRALIPSRDVNMHLYLIVHILMIKQCFMVRRLLIKYYLS